MTARRALFRARLLAVLMLAVLMLVALGAAWPGADASSGCAGPIAMRGDSTLRLRVDGVERTARLHVPRAALGRRVPLLMAFHGTGANGRFMETYSGLNAQADATGAIVVYPDADGRRWHWDEDPDDIADNADVRFAHDVLDTVARRTCIDAARVFAAGVSNGGGFTALLGCVMADRLAGIAVVAGGFGSLPPCRPARPLRVLEIHGTADPVVPYMGRPEEQRRGAVRTWLNGWVSADRCATDPRERQLAPRVQALRWSGCATPASVAHVRIAGGVHQWPGATPPDPGPRVDFAAAPAIWRFLLGPSR